MRQIPPHNLTELSDQVADGSGKRVSGLIEAFVEAMPFIAIIKDATGKYVYCNPQIAIQTAIDPGELLGRRADEIFPPKAALQANKTDAEVLEHGGPIRAYESFPARDGSRKDWLVYKFRVRHAGNDFIAATMEDVTEQRRAQRAVTDNLQRLKAALEAGFDAFFVLDAVRDEESRIRDFVLVDVNRNGEVLLGRSRWELVSHRITELIPEFETNGFVHRYIRVVETRTPLEEEFKLPGVDGELHWYRHQVVPLGDGVAITTREITAQKRTEELAKEHTRVLENALGGIAFISKDGLFEFMNPEFCRMLATSERDLIGRPWETVVDPRDIPMVEKAIASMLPDSRIEQECRGIRRNGEPLEMRVVMIPVTREGASVGHYVFAMDVTEQRRHERMLEEANVRLSELASTDSLTGLKNRREFESRLTEEVEAAGRYDQSLSLVMADIDHFKAFNDAFGHPAGDDVLKMVAGLLQKEARMVDIVSRYGGEEIAIIVPGTDLEGAIRLAERCRLSIQNADWPQAPVTASFGCAQFGPGRQTPEALLKAADDALYRAKELGRNRVEPSR